MKLLVTAGPTREYIDDIRFVSNASSGLMGASIANKAVELGHEVWAVVGPCNAEFNPDIKRIDVVDAKSMLKSVLEVLKNEFDAVILTAAVADYTPEKKVYGKIRSKSDLKINFVQTKKIIEKISELHPKTPIIAFKAEFGGSNDEKVGSAKKLLAYADLVVLNDVSKDAFGSYMDKVDFITDDGVKEYDRLPKTEVAFHLLSWIETNLFSSVSSGSLR